MTDRTELIAQLARNPSTVHGLTSRQFEEVVAELLAGMGWSVSLTPVTRDGGLDILAVRQEAPHVESNWVVECKKFRPNHRVSVEMVRNLYGVKHYLGIGNAMLVTTASFTRGALQLEQAYHDFHLIDLEKFTDWLKHYTPSMGPHGYLASGTFESCFISYSQRDSDFAEHLYARLRGSGVRVWFAPKDLVPGRKLHDEIKAAISRFDRLIIVLSDQSMASEWVKTELRLARKRELAEHRQILFPIALAPFDVLRNWECFDADTGKDLAIEIREYLVPDFSRWREEESFDRAFGGLLLGLQSAGVTV